MIQNVSNDLYFPSVGPFQTALLVNIMEKVILVLELDFLSRFRAFCVPRKTLIDDQKPLEVKRCYKNNQFRRSHTNLNSKSGKAMKDEPWTTQHNARKQKVMLEQSPP